MSPADVASGAVPPAAVAVLGLCLRRSGGAGGVAEPGAGSRRRWSVGRGGVGEWETVWVGGEEHLVEWSCCLQCFFLAACDG